SGHEAPRLSLSPLGLRPRGEGRLSGIWHLISGFWTPTRLRSRGEGPQWLELLHPGPEVELQRPGASRLPVNLPVGLGDGIRFQQRILRSLARQMSVALGPDLPIDDDVRDVDALGTQLARHRLSQRAQAEFGHREVGETGAAAQRSGGAGEKDGATTGFDHRPRGAPANQEAAKTA